MVNWSILQDEHIQWLVERLHVNPNITVKSLHGQLNEVFQFPHTYPVVMFQKPFEVKSDATLKLMCYEPDDYNNEEHLRECLSGVKSFMISKIIKHYSLTLMMTYK